jgi:hypothetical protein
MLRGNKTSQMNGYAVAEVHRYINIANSLWQKRERDHHDDP